MDYGTSLQNVIVFYDLWWFMCGWNIVISLPYCHIGIRNSGKNKLREWWKWSLEIVEARLHKNPLSKIYGRRSDSVSVIIQSFWSGSFSRCSWFVFCSEAVIERSEIDCGKASNMLLYLFFNLLNPFSKSSYELGQPKHLHSSDSTLSMWQGQRRKEEVGDVGKETEATGTFPTEEKATPANDRNLARFENHWQRFDTTNII